MKYVFLGLIGVVLASCNVSDSKEPSPAKSEDKGAAYQKDAQAVQNDSTRLTTIQWIDAEVQELGAMEKGQIAEITWRFKNTGNHPLYISDVRAGCGCTTPDVPKEPIAPGAENVIKAKFNSQNFDGHVTKEVYVEANNSNRNNGTNNKLTFSADIK